MKVDELTWPPLDYWVAKAEGLKIGYGRPTVGCYEDWHNRFPHEQDSCDPFTPSTDWAHGGPIIEKLIATGWEITPHGDEFRCANHTTEYVACPGNYDDSFLSFEAETILLVAMRAYVASKFGETVPDEAA